MAGRIREYFEKRKAKKVADERAKQERLRNIEKAEQVKKEKDARLDEMSKAFVSGTPEQYRKAAEKAGFEVESKKVPGGTAIKAKKKPNNQ